MNTLLGPVTNSIHSSFSKLCFNFKSIFLHKSINEASFKMLEQSLCDIACIIMDENGTNVCSK